MANEVSVQITLDGDQAVKALGNFNKGVDKTEKNTVQSFSKMDAAFGSFVGNLAAAGATAALGLITDGATALFDVFVVQGVAAAQAQEDAINSLNIALTASGRFTEQASQDFQAYASELQNASKFGDEVILQNAALIQSLGQLDQEGLKGATQASLDLAAALGIDLNAAATLVGKAAAGEVGSFSRFGLTIEKGATQAETFANALEGINEKFGGAAAGQIKTFSGGLTQLQNTFGDVTEVVGGFITGNDAIIASFGILNAKFVDAQKTLKDNEVGIQSFINNAIVGLVDGLAATLTVVDDVRAGFEIFFNAIIGGAQAMASGFLAPLSLVAEGLQSLANTVGVELPEAAQTGLETLASLSKDTANDAVESFEKINKALEPTAISETAVAVRSFGEDLKVALSEATTASDEYTAKSTENTQKRIEQTDAEKAAIQNALKAQTAAEEQANLASEELRLAKAEKITEEEEEEILRLEEKIGREQAIKLVALDNIAAAEQNDEVRRAKLQELSAKKEVKLKQATTKQLLAQDDQRAANFKSTLNVIAGLATSGNQTLATIGKAAAISTATIDGFAAVQKALASAPPPYNFALAALVGTATAANIAKIAGVKGFQDGGVIGGPVSNTDNQIAAVAGGELVLNRRQQTDLFNSINNNEVGGNGGGIVVNFQSTSGVSDQDADRIITALNERQEFGNNPLAATAEV